MLIWSNQFVSSKNYHWPGKSRRTSSLKFKMNQSSSITSFVLFLRQAAWQTRFFVFILLFVASSHTALATTGASVPWTTYEAANMTYNGTLLGPPPQVANNNTAPVDTVATEAVGRQCVQLNAQGQYVQFTAQAAANSIVVRYSVPDTANGTGANYTLSLYQNGTFVQELPMTSKYS